MKEELTKYQEMWELNSLYNELINNLVEFLRKIDVSRNVTGIDIIVKYMIKHNYLSNNEIKSSTSEIERDPIRYFEEKLPLPYYGLFIPYGFAVCRNIADFMHKIYGTLEYENSKLFLFAPFILKYSHPNYPNLTEDDYAGINRDLRSICEKRDIQSFKPIQVFLNNEGVKYKFIKNPVGDQVRKVGNHVINIVLDNNGLVHIFDSTSNGIGEVSSDKIFMHRNNEAMSLLVLRTYFSELFHLENGLELLKDPKFSILDDLENVRLFLYLCSKREQDFKSFKAQNSSYFDGISDNIQKLARKI